MEIHIEGKKSEVNQYDIVDIQIVVDTLLEKTHRMRKHFPNVIKKEVKRRGNRIMSRVISQQKDTDFVWDYSRLQDRYHVGGSLIVFHQGEKGFATFLAGYGYDRSCKARM